MTAIKTITTLKFDYMQTGAGENFENVKAVKSAFAEYDAEGNVLIEISYKINGEIEQKCVNKYNEKGKLSEELLFNEFGELDEKKTYEYNEKGNVISELLYYVDGTFDTTTFAYDENDKLIQKTTVGPDNEMESKKILTYENGNLVAELTTDGEGNILNKVNIEYDEKGNETKIERFIALDDKTIRTEFKYNEDGKKSEATTFANGKLVSKQMYDTNEKDELVKITEEEIFSKSITDITYDEKGNMTEQLETDNTGELNNRTIRKFNENNLLSEVNVTIDRHGNGLNQNYMIQYSYEYFE